MTTTPPPPPSTLFPKISGKHAALIEEIQYYCENSTNFPKNATEIPLVGTVKLHGAHNDIVIYPNDTIQLQSRNVLSLGLENDSFSFAHNILPLRPEILALKKRMYSRFREKNPATAIEDEHPLIIAGEWIGPGIQKGVAISELPKKLLVIISISINGHWQPDEDYADISNPEVGIYHVSHGGIFRHTLSLGTNEEMQASLATLQPLANEVERECPFAKTFGIIGAGEGIVYKPTLGTMGEDAKFWLKVKGPVSSGVRWNTLKLKQGEGMEQIELVKTFAEAVVTEPRLAQAWDYLRETGVERSMKGIGTFLRWLNEDINVEEKTEIKELGLDNGLLKKHVVVIGKEWYLKQVQEI